MPAFQPVRGMRDLIGEEAQTFTYIINNARETASLYGYKEVITPHVEPLELLSAKSGEEIRQKESPPETADEIRCAGSSAA